MTELPPKLEEALKTGLDNWGITVTGELTSQREGKGYEVEVPFEGELLFDKFYDDHGNLIYNKEAEVLLKGVSDGKLLVTVLEKER